jgi:signal transduction histidine kinase
MVLLTATLSTPQSAAAVTYGQNKYGICKFTTGCPAQHTVVETKTGLDVAINLVDGQQIPNNGYEVKVTPLNGAGRSFERVEFYLDGKLISTFYPDSTGTATWQWDTAAYQGSTVKIIVYDADGSSVTKEFHIKIVEPSQVPVAQGSASELPATSGDNIFSQFLSFLSASVQAIPTPIAVSIPYLLLFVLLAIILLMYLQSRREAKETRLRLAALDRSRQIAQEKDGFIELASHYLRTPLTLIKGGVDFLGAVQPPVSVTLLGSITLAVNDFGDAIERLLSNVSNDPRLQNIPSEPNIKGTARGVWASPMFWLPVGIVGIVLGVVHYLLVESGKLEFSLISLATQFSIYAALIAVLYTVLRRQELYAREHKRADTLEQQQTAIDEARNQLIREAAATLAQKLEALHVYLVQAPDGQGKTFMMDGYTRIAEVLRRFRATATVIPPITSMQFVHFSLSALVTQAEKQVAQTASEKSVAIVGASNDIQLATPQPSWIVQILGSVLDNAVAYSQPGSTVEVGGKVENNLATLSVTDHGSGIPPQKLTELFQPFSKAEGAMQFDHPGIGLSLYLDRLLITNLGGAITIESTPGGGTIVFMTFPVA